jgi:CRISPR-associated protein Csd1
MIENLMSTTTGLRLSPTAEASGRYIPLWALLRETVNSKASDKTPLPQMSGDVLRSILTGGRYPETLFNQTMLRIRAERKITRGRAAIIKAI